MINTSALRPMQEKPEEIDHLKTLEIAPLVRV
jgi:hypothetical protein